MFPPAAPGASYERLAYEKHHHRPASGDPGDGVFHGNRYSLEFEMNSNSRFD